ncbi:MAG: DUF4097 family beta strand repeat protein [Deltaproteobacteria bacterium]|nr:MAG: DUF4097 family beta strand repeat protein [Deltaproteobacteria bacterium]
MTARSRPDEEPSRGGFSNLLRALFSGIPWSESAERTDVLREPLGRGGAVRVHNSNGRIHVIGEAREDVEVRACKRARAESQDAAARLLDDIVVESSNDAGGLSFEVQIPKRWNRRGNVNLQVRVPRTAPVAIEAVNGKLLVEGLRSTVRAHSSNGPISVDDVIGDIELHTSNGKVSCTTTKGRLRARCSCGKIELREHCGPVDASTSNGSIRAMLDDVENGDVRLATSNGRIVLELPDAIDADVDVHVDNGVFRNERELGQETRTVNGRVRGVLGAGGSLVRLRCSNGSISIR